MRLTQLFALFAIASIVLVSFAGESSGSVQVLGHTSDREVIEGGGFRATSDTGLIGGGYRGGPSKDVNALLAFEIPGSVVPGSIVSASLSVYLRDVANHMLNGQPRMPAGVHSDWYFVGSNTSAAPPSSVEFVNDDVGKAGDIKFSDNVVDVDSSTGWYTENLNSSAVGALDNALSSGENFVYLRLNNDVESTINAYHGFLWASANHSNVPYLTIETGELVAHMPEPASLATWSVLAAIPIGLWRRRENS